MIQPALWALLAGSAAAASIVDSDFRAGTPGHGGQNIYVNSHGELEVIRRHDIDGNGYVDLPFNSTHDMEYAVPASLASIGSDGQLRTFRLDVSGARQVLAGDLNRDRHPDLVFVPYKQNTQNARNSLTIAWGADGGWSSERLTRQLPVENVAAGAIIDLNQDGWPDLVTLNGPGWIFGQPPGNIVRIFWGGAKGFLSTHLTDFGVPGATLLTAGYFGPDRVPAVATLTSSGVMQFLRINSSSGKIEAAPGEPLSLFDPALPPAVHPTCLLLEPGAAQGGDTIWVGTDTSRLFRTDGKLVQSISTGPASHLAIGDLDHDGIPDLVVTHYRLSRPDTPGRTSATTVTIWWGTTAAGVFTAPTPLAIPNAVATCIADVNSDGRPDLVVAVHQSDETKDPSSLVYLGRGTRTWPDPPLRILTQGAKDVLVTRSSPSSPAVVVFANRVKSTLDDAVPVRLYWGSAAGFSPEARTDLPNLGGYKSSLADLNSDGWVDLIVTNGGDVAPETADHAPRSGAIIYWGGKTGEFGGPGPVRFSLARSQVLREGYLGSINVADVDRDGFLDLILGKWEDPARPGAELVIYHGAAAGFRPEGRQVLAEALPVSETSVGCLVADFNRDGWLDISICAFNTNQILTYWGGPQGYSTARKSALPYPAPIELETADLNHDGWLDLLVGSYHELATQHHDMGFSIFWGAATGWSQARSQWLPGMAPQGIAVADLDGDGRLDIVCPNYLGELSREHLASYIYWGEPEGYSIHSRTSLTVDSASDVIIADFDRDGRPDLAFAAHSHDSGHLLDTPIYFNDGHRFHSPRVQYLPVVGPHYSWVQDSGNIYDRQPREEFISRPLPLPASLRGLQAQVKAELAFGALVKVAVRGASSDDDLASAPWQELTDAVRLGDRDKVFQYRLELRSANGDAYPRIRAVELTFK